MIVIQILTTMILNISSTPQAEQFSNVACYKQNPINFKENDSETLMLGESMTWLQYCDSRNLATITKFNDILSRQTISRIL